MAKSDGFFEEFGPHSLHKLLIFNTYFQSWGRKMLLRAGATDRICVVDACAGRGHDDAGNPGSPFIAAHAAAEAETQLAERFGRTVHIDVIAIEKHPPFFRELREYLTRFGDRARVLEGTLDEHWPRLEAELGETPTLFFIDPFGLEPLKAEAIRRALMPPKNEALLLFADQAALRHFGAAQSIETAAMRALREHDQTIGLFEELHQEERDDLAKRAKKSHAALEITREKAIEILDDAFGDIDWRTAMEGTPRHLRRAKLLTLYQEFLRNCTAYFTLAIPILNNDGEHVYFLLHATKSVKGYRTMKEAVHFALGHSPLPADVVEGMKELLRADLAEAERQVRAHFAGKRVRWAEDKDDREAPSLRQYLLERTKLHQFQCAEFQKRIMKEKQPDRTIYYQF